MKNLDTALKNMNIFPSSPQKVDTNSFFMGDHCYAHTELFYVLEGTFILTVDTHTYIVQKNQMALLPAHHPHTYWKLPHQHLSYYAFSVKTECHGEDFFEFFGLADDHHVVNIPPELVTRCFEQSISSEYNSDNMTRRINLCLQQGQLCLMYAHARLSEKKAKSEYADIIGYLREHITEDVSLYTLSQKFHFEPTYFVKKFRKQVGVTPMKYFGQMRAKHAASLLKTTEMTVSDVAAATGFSNVYYFKNFFARHMGLLPEQYKEILNRPKELRFSET